MRQYNETSIEKFSDFRQCEMLNNALQGESMGALSQVLNNANTARVAAGNNTPLDSTRTIKWYSMLPPPLMNPKDPIDAGAAMLT